MITLIDGLIAIQGSRCSRSWQQYINNYRIYNRYNYLMFDYFTGRIESLLPK